MTKRNNLFTKNFFTTGQDEGTTSDSSETTEGPCGGDLITGSYELLKNPGYPDASNPQGTYPPNTDCEWNYEGDEDTFIAVSFTNNLTVQRLD